MPSAKEKRKREIRNIAWIKELRLLDDIFMKVVLRGNTAGVQDISRVILNRNDITVEKVTTQDEFSNLVGHSVRIDVLARDTEGKLYNIEIQRSRHGADEKRARYNLGAVDWHTLPPGADYDELPETWVIFITETDIWGRGLPVYTVNRCIMETGEWFQDEGHILYVNGAYEGENDIGRLMADFREKDPKKMRFQSLADRARFYKNEGGGMTSMSSVMEKWLKEEREEGRQEGRQEGRVEGRQEGRQEGRVEGRQEGRQETRIMMVMALLEDNSEEELLHDRRFRGLRITPEEIDEAKAWAEEGEEDETDSVETS